MDALHWRYTAITSGDMLLTSAAFPSSLRGKLHVCGPKVSVYMHSQLVTHVLRSWSVLVGSALHPALPLLTSHGPIDERRPPLDLPSDCEGFDWSSESRCQILPTLFKPAKPESPVDISFDHYRAALGQNYVIYCQFTINFADHPRTMYTL